MTTLATRTSNGVQHDASPSNPGVATSGSSNGADEFSRAVIDSVVNKRGDTLSISVQS